MIDQWRQSGLKSGGRESGRGNVGFEPKIPIYDKYFDSSGTKIPMTFSLVITSKMFVAPKKSKNYHLQLHSGLIFIVS